ncbi:MAG: hypothetical protein H0X04_00070 [Chthoniobacterales bacterium]|nr:hypothetical protein [Chthoniobacterales bacterium]
MFNWLNHVNICHCINLLSIVLAAIVCAMHGLEWTAFWLVVSVLSEVALLKQGKVKMEP